jgi:hypothetical protein
MSTVKLAVVDGKTITQATELQGGKAAGPMKIRSVKGGKFMLADTKTGHAPENITIKRAGKNLLVSLEGDDLEHPSLIIEDFYGNEAQIVGMGEDGAYHEYVAADAQDEHEAAFLADGADSPLVLGAQNMAGFSGSDLVAAPAAGLGAAGLGAAGWAALGLAGLAAAGMIGAGIIDSRRDNGNNNGGGGDNGGGGGGGGGDGPDPANGDHLLPTIGQVIDSVGSITGPIAPGGFTDDKAPTVTGTGTAPGNKIEIYDNGQKIGEAIVKADGTWEFKPATALGDGPHNLYVVEHDSVTGAVGKPSLNFEFTVDTVAPAMPTFEVVDQNGDPIGNPTNEAKPVFRGDGVEPGNKVIIRDKDTGEEIGSVVVGEDGAWEISPGTPITDGDRHFEVIVEDPAGNSSHTDYNLEIDTTPPADPTFVVEDQNGNPIGSGDSTNDTNPVFRGSDGDEGDKVIIRDPNTGDIIGSTIVDEHGNWEIPVDTGGAEGDHHYEVVIQDPAGNESNPIGHDLIIDTTPPAAPTLDEVYDDVGSQQGPLNSGDTTDDARPRVSGTAEAHSTVYIYNGAKLLGSTQVDANGKWSWESTTDLLNGSYSLVARAHDAAGNISDPSNSFDFTLITGGTPPAPAIVNVVDDVGSIQGPLQPGDVTDDTTPTVNGTAQPGMLVTLYADGVAVGSVIADATTGQWSISPSPALTEGSHDLTARATNAAGNQSPETGAFTIIVDTTPPSDLDTSELKLIDNVGPVQGEIHNGDDTDDANPEFKGKGEAGDTIIIRDNGKIVGSVVVDGSGNWSWTPSTALPDGPHSLTAQPVDRAGNAGNETAPIWFGVDTSHINISLTEVMDSVGVIQGPISNGGVTDDTTPTLSGRGTPGGIVKIYDTVNGTKAELGSTTVDARGSWSFPVPQPLAEGPHSLTATVTTSATGESAPTPAWNIEVDITPPDAGTIGDILDDVGTIQGPIVIDNGRGVTDDTTPTLTGNGLTKGDTVVIRDGGNEIGTAIVKEDGSWSYTPTTPLGEGDHELTIVVRDPAGNESNPSTPIVIEVDTTPPADAVFEVVDQNGDPISDGGTTGDAAPIFRGTGGDEGDTVIVRDETGAVIGSGKVQPDGSWKVDPDTPLAAGDHHFEVVIKDPAGNESNPIGYDVTVDLTAPTANALIDDMGKDAGFNDSDWVTNDGSAGRLISGHVNGALASGEKVQVSTDGGTTWFDAVVRADGTWFAVDPNAHGGDFEIQARVVNGFGTPSAVAQQAVTLDETPPNAPAAYTLTANGVSVDIQGTNAVAGDKIHVQHGGATFDYTLTAADTAAGRAAVAVPGGVDSSLKLAISVVDQAGNISPAIGANAGAKVWDFNDNTMQGWQVGAPYTYGDGGLVVSNGHLEALTGSGNDWAGPIMSTLVYVEAGQSYNFSFDYWNPATTSGVSVSDISVAIDGVDVISGIGPVVKAGVKNAAGTYTAAKSGYVQIVFNNAQSNFNGNDFAFDNIKLEPASGAPLPAPTDADYVVTADTSSLYGGVGDNVFTVADASDFTHITQIAGNGGMDTLKLTGAGQVLDVTALNSGTTDKITGIEVFDIGGTGDNTLKLSINDVLNLGAKDGFTADGHYQVMVKGGVGDRVELSELMGGGAGGWQQNGSVSLAGVKYHIYLNATTGAEVLVQDGITVVMPATAVFVDSMGKDAGFNDSDWLTNDGSAGRLIHGHLDSFLGAAAKVQVSTDGGASWFDAIVRADGTWFAVDPNNHSGDFEIQARIVEGGSVRGAVAQQTVTLDTDVPPPPSAMSVDTATGVVTVKLEAGGAAAGEKIHVLWGEHSFEYELTAADIAAGTVAVQVPDDVRNATATPDSVQAAVVDAAGNVSDHRTYGGPAHLDFKDTPHQRFFGTPMDAGVFTAYAADVDSGIGAGTLDLAYHLRGAPKVVLNGGKTSAHMDAEIWFDGKKEYHDSAPRSGALHFYDANGGYITSVSLKPGRHTYSIDMPAGKEFASFTFSGSTQPYNMGHATFYDMKLSGGDFELRDLGTAQPPAEQTVGAHTETLYGGSDDNVFVVNDVADFAHVTQIGGNGGTDTLKLTGAGQVLDVTALNSGTTDKITGIEVFDIGGTGGNTLKLSMNDVLNLGAKDQFTADGYYQVMVKGDAGDRLELSNLIGGGAGGWAQNGRVNIGGVAYHVYRNDTTKAEVLVQDGITVGGQLISADFNQFTASRYLAIGEVLDIGPLKVTNINSAKVGGPWGTGIEANTAGALQSPMLAVDEGVLNVDLKGSRGSIMTASLFDLQTNFGGQELRFYDGDRLILTVDLHQYASGPNPSQFNGRHTWTMPDGETFTRFEFDGGTEWIAMDDIVVQMPMSAPPQQSLVLDAGLFQADDVSALDQCDVITGNDGIDTLQLTGADQVLDFSALQGKVSSVEVIDITGTGDNTLKLSLGDVLEQGGKDLFVADGKTQMMVKGNDGDTLELSDLIPDGADVGDWAQQNGTVTVEGAQYNVFVHEGLNAELLVQIGIQTHLDNH